jgi:hypothetical protein
VPGDVGADKAGGSGDEGFGHGWASWGMANDKSANQKNQQIANLQKCE